MEKRNKSNKQLAWLRNKGYGAGMANEKQKQDRIRRFAAACEALGGTQAELADLFGLKKNGQVYVCSALKGRRVPSETLVRLAEVLARAEYMEAAGRG